MNTSTIAPVPRRLTYWNSLLVTNLVLSVLLLVVVEWDVYRNAYWRLMWVRPQAPWRVAVVLGWMVWAKTIVLIAPALGLAGFLMWRGWPRTALTLGTVASVVVGSFLALDIQTMVLSGKHLTYFLQFAFTRGAVGWIGGPEVLVPAARTIVAISLVTVAAMWCTHRLGVWVDRRHSRWIGWGPTFVLAGGLVMGAAAQRIIDDGEPRYYRRLAADLPIRMDFLAGAAAARGEQEAFCRRFESRFLGWYRGLRPKFKERQPIDESLTQPVEPLPNVIILILESLRHDVLDGKVMKNLDALSERGLRFTRHYSGSNQSTTGLYALMQGRDPFTIHRDLDREDSQPAQFPASMGQLGYERVLTSSAPGSLAEWDLMGRYFDARGFEQMVDTSTTSPGDWPTNDLACLDEIRRLVRKRETDGGKPLFLVAYLMSTHYDYRYPRGEAPFQPAWDGKLRPPGAVKGLDRTQFFERLFNRYKNAAAYLDRIVAELIHELDWSQNIVVVTGDHGESLWDDGRLAHGDALSEIQTRTAMVMLGAGIPARRITEASLHQDVLPTILHAVLHRPTALAGVRGRNHLAEEPPRSVFSLVRNRLRHEWNVMLVDGENRFEIELDLDRPAVRAIGFVDEHAVPLPGIPDRQDPDVWSARFHDYLRAALAQPQTRIATGDPGPE